MLWACVWQLNITSIGMAPPDSFCIPVIAKREKIFHVNKIIEQDPAGKDVGSESSAVDSMT